MTTIIIRKNHEGIYRGFYCMGHGTAKKRFGVTENSDILCAAILYWCKVPSDRFHNWQVKNFS